MTDATTEPQATPPRPFRRLTARRALTLAALALLLLTASCMCHIPQIRGRVLDAATGAPVEGALVARVGYRIPEFTILESPPPSRVDSTQTSTRTDADGRFELDGGWMLGFNHVEWRVLKRGLMPAGGVYGPKRWGLVAPFGFESRFQGGGQDSWAPRTAELKRGSVEVVVWTRQPATPAPPGPTPQPGAPTPPWTLPPTWASDEDPWTEYFRRLGLMVQERWIPVETFVEEAESYAAARPLTEGVAREINNMQYQLGSLREDGTYRNPREGLALVTLVAEYCRQNPETAMCKREEWMLSRSVERFRRIGGGQ